MWSPTPVSDRTRSGIDEQYKKAHLEADPFGGASHAKGIVLGKVGVKAKKPNSAIRKCVQGVAHRKWRDCLSIGAP